MHKTCVGAAKAAVADEQIKEYRRDIKREKCSQ